MAILPRGCYLQLWAQRILFQHYMQLQTQSVKVIDRQNLFRQFLRNLILNLKDGYQVIVVLIYLPLNYSLLERH